MKALEAVLNNPEFNLKRLSFGALTLEGENLQLLLSSREDAENEGCFFPLEALGELTEALADLLPPPAPTPRAYTPRTASTESAPAPEMSAEEKEEETLRGYYFSVFKDKKRVRLDEFPGTPLEKLQAWYDSLPQAAKDKLTSAATPPATDESATPPDGEESAASAAPVEEERLSEDEAF